MYLLQVLNLMLSFVMAASAFPKAPGVHVAQGPSMYNISDFLISDLTLVTFPLPGNLTFTHALTSNSRLVNFTDPNSNGTNTICNGTWTSQNNGSNTAPISYLDCKPTNISESFIWEFTRITNLTNFALRLAHDFSDPVHYPPPFTYIELFSDVNVTLKCDDPTCCHLKEDPLPAKVDALAN